MRKHVLAFLVVSAALLTSCQKAQPTMVSAAAIDANKYYAILLTNGSVYFGHLEGLGTPFPVLHDVYYVQSTQNQETKTVNNMLVKRGKEWHAPDRMILSEKSIVFVEPVGPDSRVSQLIAESKH